MRLSRSKAAAFLFLFAVVFSQPTLYRRISVENENRTVEILLDSRMEAFNNAAVINEYTFAELEAFTFATLCRPGIKHPFKNKPPGSSVMVFEWEKIFNEATINAELKFGTSTIRTKKHNSLYYILFESLAWRDISDKGAGIVIPDSAAGKRKYIRPVNDSLANLKSIERIFEKGNYEGVIFKGTEVLGYPDHIEYVNRRLKETGIIVFNIEFSPQKGMREVSSGLPVALLHSIPDDMKEGEAVRRGLRAIRERSVRGFYFRDRSNAEAFKNHIEKHPISTGSPAGALIVSDPVFLSYAAALALLSGLFLASGFNSMAVFSVAVFLFLTSFIWPAGVKNILIISTAAAVPPLSVKIAMNRRKHLLSALIFIAAFSFLGGIVISSVGWSAELYTKINHLRGIKLSFILPIALGAAVFLSEEIKSILNKEVKWLHLIAAVALGAVLGFMVFRTANVSGQFVSGVEIYLRNILEKLFVFRPRFKEFLIGNPLLIAGLYIYSKNKSPSALSKVLLVLGLMGPVSVINSFMHIHTPIAASVIRSFYGWIVGLPVGAALILFVRKCQQLKR